MKTQMDALRKTIVARGAFVHAAIAAASIPSMGGGMAWCARCAELLLKGFPPLFFSSFPLYLRCNAT